MRKKRDNWGDGLRGAYHALKIMNTFESLAEDGSELLHSIKEGVLLIGTVALVTAVFWGASFLEAAIRTH
jgi:hypothetical protein